MICKIEFKNDAYGTIDKEYYIDTTLSNSQVYSSLDKFKKCILELKLSPEVACANAFGPDAKIADMTIFTTYY